MIRLHAIVEGQTEESFIRDLLAPELAELSVFTDSSRITTGRKKGVRHRGGFVSYKHLRGDLQRWMRQENKEDVRFTTMVDLYGIPPDFPGMENCRGKGPFERALILQQALKDDLGDHRLLPYIQIHEFEALLFSKPEAFLVAFPDDRQSVEALSQIKQASETPEHIDDDEPPSKRIERVFPGYQKQKVSAGIIIAKEIGLSRMRQECKHFDLWITSLLRLGDDKD